MRTLQSICFTICLLTGIVAAAQETNDIDKARKFLYEVMQRYRDSSSLAFDLSYRYAMKDDPGKFLDSLSGRFMMHGNKYWYKLDNTEVASNGEFVVMLFEDDYLMYLAKPEKQLFAAGPVPITDSMIEKAGFDEVQLSDDRASGFRMLKLSAPEGSTYRSISFFIGIRSGLIEKAIYEVTADQLYDESVRSRIEDGKEKIATIEVTFSNYERKRIEDSTFDMGHYFSRQDGQWVTSPRYSNYKIFIGTPNL